MGCQSDSGDTPAPSKKDTFKVNSFLDFPLTTAAREFVIDSTITFDTLANGDTIFTIIKDTTAIIVSEYNYVITRVEKRPKKPGLPPLANQAPTARAGNDIVITLPINSVRLDGTASTDPEGATLRLYWRKVSGPAATMADTNKAVCIVTAMVAGNYVFELRAIDPLNAFTADLINVTVNPATTTAAVYNFTPQIIPFTNPDIIAPARGAEQWHDRNDVNIPAEGAPQQPLDRYQRFLWTRLEGTTQGSYNWTYFDNLVEQCKAKKQKLNFGIITVMTDISGDAGGQSYDGGISAYPQYLHQLMQSESVKDWKIGSSWIANYNSTHYHNRLLALHQALNAHIYEKGYQNIIGIIDIRGYGNWGEWHSAYGDGFVVSQYPAGTFPTAASLKKIVDAFINGFPNHQLVAMIAAFDAQWLNNTYNPPEIAHYILTHRGNNAGPIGWRRDQWGATDGYLRDYLENNNRSFNGLVFKDSIMARWKRAPITGEPPGWNPSEFSDLERQVRLYHASSFGNGNYGGGTAPSSLTTRDRIRAASKASGYRLVITGGQLSTNAGSVKVSINWQNTGIAPTYENWQIVYELVNSSGGVVWTGNSVFKLRHFLPQSTPSNVTETFTAVLPAGDLQFRVTVKDPTGYRAPLQLAIQGRNNNGNYTMPLIKQ